MKIRKLNARGFSHELVIVAAIVITGITGSALLVLSHADSCTPASGPMSGVSVPASDCAVSGATSQPVSTPVASCTIQMTPSTAPKYGSAPTFNVTVTNSSSNTLNAPTLTTQLGTYNTNNTTKTFTLINSGSLRFGAITQNRSATAVYAPGWNVTYATTPAGSTKASSSASSKVGVNAGFVTATSSSPSFQCRVDFALPQQSGNLPR